MGEYGLVVTTVATTAAAEKLALLLLEQRLAAGVQMEAIYSYYHWQGEIRREPEQRLWIQCLVADYGAIEHLIQAHHSYDVPEIILLPISEGLPAYLSWIKESTQ